jgi:hypothetical protein
MAPPSLDRTPAGDVPSSTTRTSEPPNLYYGWVRGNIRGVGQGIADASGRAWLGAAIYCPVLLPAPPG